MRNKTKPTLQEIYREMADDYLTDAIELHRTHKGVVKAIFERTGEISSDGPIARTQICVWLNADPERRDIPRLGTGLLIAKIARELRESGTLIKNEAA